MQVLETVYNGIQFRSRLEARWAVVFDTLMPLELFNVRWEYEKEGFDLDAAGWYLPDFYFPAVGGWVEIKATRPTPQEIAKARALSLFRQEDVLVIVGLPTPDEFFGQVQEQALLISSSSNPPGDMTWGPIGWMIGALVALPCVPPHARPLMGHLFIMQCLAGLATARAARVDNGALHPLTMDSFVGMEPRTP